MGKTALQVNMALNAARRGSRVGIFSMEMSKQRLVARMIAIETGISTTKQRSGKLTDAEWVLYYEAIARLDALPIIIDDTPKLTPAAMRSRAVRWQGEHGVNFLMGDYIGLMTMPGIRPDDRNALMTECSGSCQALSRELNIPFLMASQLSRDLEKRQDKRPMLSDLRDSGSLEQDADMVLFIYRDDAYNDNTERPNQADIIIAKNRDGDTGTAALYFERTLTRFSDLTRTTIDLTPYNNVSYRSTQTQEAAR